jgi:hypothetical protein
MISRRSLLAAAPWLAGCASLGRFPFDGEAVDPTASGVHVRFYSVGCFLVRRGDVALLTDPFWSHLPLGQVASGIVRPDPEALADVLPELASVRAVTVGHGHYDHVLGLPAAAPHTAPDARIFASRTVRHTFAPEDLGRAIVEVNDVAASDTDAGRWQTAPGLRVLPIRSGHPDNIPGIHLFQRRLTEDRATAPERASHYQEGDTFGFLVDFLEGDDVAFRVYVQTSSRGHPDGFVPESVLSTPVDLALLAMDCANIEARTGESIIDLLRPSTVLFCHWGDFFRPKDRTPFEGVKVKLPRSRRQLISTEETRFLFPAWGAEFHLRERA